MPTDTAWCIYRRNLLQSIRISQHRRLYLCLLLFLLLCCYVAVLFLLLYCCVVFVLVVVLFDIGRAISLGRIPSNAFYQKPEWFFFMAQQPLGGQVFLGIESPRSHSDRQTDRHTHTYTNIHTLGTTPLGELSANAEASTSQHTHTHTHNRQTSMPPVGFEPAIPGKRGAVDPRLRTRGYWDRFRVIGCSKNKSIETGKRK